MGLDTKALDMIDSMIQKDIDYGFTSAQLAVVKDGSWWYPNAWGTVNAYNQDGTPKTDSEAVTTDTLYDLASNTKMYAPPITLCNIWCRMAKLNLSDPITKFFPSFAEPWSPPPRRLCTRSLVSQRMIGLIR